MLGLKSNQLEQNVKYNIPRLGELQQQAAQASIEASMSLDGEFDQQSFVHIHNTQNLGTFDIPHHILKKNLKKKIIALTTPIW